MNQLMQPILHNRTGGANNINGINYQIEYSIYRILQDIDDTKTFQLEGLEDLDCHIVNNNSVYYQLKCKTTDLDITVFNDDILKNLLEVYNNAPQSDFVIVSNRHIKGQLKEFKESKHLSYWSDKIKSKGYNFNESEITHFLSKISFERIELSEIQKKIKQLLIAKYDIHTNNLPQFCNALYVYAKEWSRLRTPNISKKMILQVIQGVKDDTAKGYTNQAVNEGWIKKIDFQPNPNEQETFYYQGKSAQPYHIAADLPIKRDVWEQEIKASVTKHTVTVIKASSGQGKSTLAWQTAKALQDQNGKTVYQIFRIENEGLEDLNTFIKQRCQIGEQPLIVFDGLNIKLAFWSEIVDKTAHLPVKYLLTTREEDWFRYSANAADIDLKPINIDLKKDEAEQIFRKFRKKGLVNPAITDWRGWWEAVAEEKLLIEFIYLITEGKMLQERLSEQVQTIRAEPDAAAKLDILRMVCAADIGNASIKTDKLLVFLNEKYPATDKNTLLNSLAQEYQIQFQSNQFIEGLHPVRSKHLFDILHTSLPIAITFNEVQALLEDKDLIGFSQQSLILIPISEQESFLEKTAAKVEVFTYLQILEIIYGVFAYDAHCHWLENKQIYDGINNRGIELYLMEQNLFADIDMDAAFKLGSIENQAFTTEVRNSLQKVEKQNMRTCLYLKKLFTHLQTKEIKSNINGLPNILRWFQDFDLPTMYSKKITVEHITVVFYTLDIEAFALLLYNVFKLNEDLYYRFYNENKTALQLSLSKKFKILNFETKADNTLKANYLPDLNSGNLNDWTVKIIKNIAYSMPFYSNYHVLGYYADFINPTMTDAEIRSFLGIEKLGSFSTWLRHDEFSVKRNILWDNAALKNYQFQTVYEWQNYWFEYRKLAVLWAEQFNVHFLTALTENATKKQIIASFPKIVHENLLNYSDMEKTIRYGKRFDEEEYKKLVKQTTDWKMSMHNLLKMVTGLGIDTENNWRLFWVNAANVHEKHREMQTSFNTIALATADYFDTTALMEQENKVYAYFTKTVDFIHHQIKQNGSLQQMKSPKKVIQEWHHDIKQDKMRNKVTFAADYKKATGLEIIYGKKRESLLDILTIGIRNVQILDFLTNEQFILCLEPITTLGFDITNIFVIHGSNVLMGFRLKDDIFEHIKNGSVTAQNCFTLLIPDDTLLAPLKDYNLSLPKPALVEQQKLILEMWYYATIKMNFEANTNDLLKYKNELLNNHEQQIHTKTNIVKRVLHDTALEYERFFIAIKTDAIQNPQEALTSLWNITVTNAL